MPLKKRSHSLKKIDTGWVPDRSGYQKTRSPKIIAHSMQRLKEGRKFINLAHKKYSSGNTILVNFSTKHMEIDRPLDWPNQLGGTILVRFQNELNLICHYKAKIVKVTEKSVITEFPFELFQLQRRQYFRVSVPGSNSVSLHLNGDKRSGLLAQDVSIRGILVYKKSNQLFEIGDEVRDLSLDIYTIPKSKESEKLFSLQAQLGKVVRLSENSEFNQYLAGLQLFPDKKEEKELHEYIRKRELSDLRKH